MTDAHGVARDQLRAFIERIERLEEEKKTIADDIKDVYGEAKGMGFIPALMKKVIALRKKDEMERQEEEAILDTYLHALGMLDQPDFFHETPAETKTSVGSGRGSAAPLRMQPETATEHPHHLKTTRGDESGTLEGSVEDHGQAAGRTPESQTDGNVTVTAGETAIQFHAKASDDACEAGRKALGRAEASADAPDGAELVSRGVGDRAPTATSEAMDVTGGESAASNSEKDTAVHGNAGRHSPDRVSPQAETATTGSVGANTGGSHVDGSVERAPGQQQGNTSNTAGGTVSNPPAKPLRPHCLRPENCGGYGSNHCFSCRKAAKANDEEEAA